MLSSSDRGRFPDGVRAHGDHLVDDIRGDAWPMNASAAFVVDRMGAPLGTVVAEFSCAFRVPVERARADVLSFVLTMNARLLLNVEHPSRLLRRLSSLVILALRLAPAGALPAALARRRPLDTATTVRAIWSALRAVAARALLVAATVGLLALHLVLVAGVAGVVLAAVVGLGAGAGFALHEAGHAAALTGVPAAVVLRGRRTYVLHRPVGSGRSAVVAVAGPAPVAVVGGLLVLLALATSFPLLAVGGLAPAAHALSLTVATTDGRCACGL
jgi:hypothetical protein